MSAVDPYYLKGKERDSMIKECAEMIRIYSSLYPSDSRFRASSKKRLDYYRDVRRKLTSDIRYENLLKRNSP